jgi:two-component system OmpR family sensor kinase
VPDAVPGDLLARLEQAEVALRARDDFLAIAAHELRSPLHALGLRVAALQRLAERSGNAQLAHELERARRSVERYVRRAVTLLDLSRAHAGALRPQPRPVRAAEVVRSVVEDYADEAAFHGASLHADVQQEDLEGWWDPHMIEQILVNLVSNAIKYGHGTPVHVRAGRSAPGCACFEISDQGPGIAPADRQRIFEKFERAVARDTAGFGLGLWIVGRMVSAHGGTVEVQDRPGGGALFRVLLPLQLPAGGEDQNKDDKA